MGAVRVRIGRPRRHFDAASGRLSVTIRIRERAPSRVAQIHLPTEVELAGSGRPLLRLAADRPFDLAAYIADRDSMAAWYRKEGWMDARVQAVLETKGTDVVVRYLAEPGLRSVVGEVQIAQSGGLRESIVRRLVDLEPGARIDPKALAESREGLSDLSVLRSVEVRTVPRPTEPGVRDVVVNLAGKPDLSLEYGIRYTTSGSGSAGEAPSSPDRGQIRLAGALEASNPFGLGWRARTYALLTADRRSWGVTLGTATLLGIRIGTQLFFFDDSDTNDEIGSLASRVRGVGIQQSRALLRDRRGARWHERLKLQWGYTLKDINYSEVENQSVVLEGVRGFVSVSLIGDERDSFTDPKKGIFWTATSEIARENLGSDVNYFRLYGQFFAYRKLGPLVWAQGLRVGTVPGQDPLLLLENRFMAGGSTTVRGFAQNALGPTLTTGEPIGGQAVVVLNEELRFPVWRKLHGGVFWDAGNSWATSDELSLTDLRQSVGVGLRFLLPFGPIRVDYSWVVKPGPEEDKRRIAFGLGYAF